MENLEMIKRIVKSYDYLSQRDIFSEECAEMIFAMEEFDVKTLSEADYDSLSGRYVDTDILDEFSDFYDEVADLYICCTAMCMYLGDDSIEQFITNRVNLSTRKVDSNDIQKLAVIIKQVSKCKRNDSVTNIKEAFERFEEALYDICCSIYDLGQVSKDMIKIKAADKLRAQMKRMDEECTCEIEKPKSGRYPWGKEKADESNGIN